MFFINLFLIKNSQLYKQLTVTCVNYNIYKVSCNYKISLLERSNDNGCRWYYNQCQHNLDYRNGNLNFIPPP